MGLHRHHGPEFVLEDAHGERGLLHMNVTCLSFIQYIRLETIDNPNISFQVGLTLESQLIVRFVWVED